MFDLVRLAVKEQGGMASWARHSRIRATATISRTPDGARDRDRAPDEVLLECDVRGQRMTILSFPGADRRPAREPLVRAAGGIAVAERPSPGTSPAGPVAVSAADLHVASFAADANWNMFTAPFLLTRPDFVVAEIEPWYESGRTWRSLRVTYLDPVVGHTRQHVYRFDEAGLLRRLECGVDILGGGPAVHHLSDYREFGGVLVPTRRRVEVHRPGRFPGPDRDSTQLDIRSVVFDRS